MQIWRRGHRLMENKPQRADRGFSLNVFGLDSPPLAAQAPLYENKTSLLHGLLQRLITFKNIREHCI